VASRTASSPALASRHLEAFLEMMAAERGAARLTIAAYRNDLVDFAGFLAASGIALEASDGAA
jgi:integrase/recombinase XerD